MKGIDMDSLSLVSFHTYFTILSSSPVRSDLEALAGQAAAFYQVTLSIMRIIMTDKTIIESTRNICEGMEEHLQPIVDRVRAASERKVV